MANSKKRCTYCKCYFPSEDMIQAPVGNFCTNEHRFKYGYERTSELRKKSKEITRKKHASEKREYRANDRPKRLREAQKVFNAYIRKRDEKLPCISCDRAFIENTVGGSWDCGHFLTVGAHPELRFEEFNAHRQCKSCNGGSGKYTRKNHSVAKQYRSNLIERIGLGKVEWLEGPHDQIKLTATDLKDIEAEYKAKLKDITP